MSLLWRAQIFYIKTSILSPSHLFLAHPGWQRINSLLLYHIYYLRTYKVIKIPSLFLRIILWRGFKNNNCYKKMFYSTESILMVVSHPHAWYYYCLQNIIRSFFKILSSKVNLYVVKSIYSLEPVRGNARKVLITRLLLKVAKP